MQAKIKSYIYRLLARREYSVSQLQQKLLQKGYLDEDVQKVINEFIASGTISDRRYTESLIRYRQSQGYGPLRVRQELQSRGIPQEMIEDHLDITDNAWFLEISRVWRKKFKGQYPATLKDRGKQIRFLQYRGFTHAQIEAVLEPV